MDFLWFLKRKGITVTFVSFYLTIIKLLEKFLMKAKKSWRDSGFLRRWTTKMLQQQKWKTLREYYCLKEENRTVKVKKVGEKGQKGSTVIGERNNGYMDMSITLIKMRERVVDKLAWRERAGNYTHSLINPGYGQHLQSRWRHRPLMAF